MGTIRGNNSSPGVYSKFTDISYAAKTLGITTLGLVGETKIGPAFEPVKISKWEEFVSYFGGLSAEKFKDTQYPKYELPYIAKTYLTKSDQLYVCRILGLSGYNAGPAFIIYGNNGNSTTNHVVAILRARGEYKKYTNIGTVCNPISAYDTIDYKCDKIVLKPYQTLTTQINCNDDGYSVTGEATSEDTIKVSEINLGQFCIQAYKNGEAIGQPIPVSLNPGSKEYIYNVLGNTPGDESNAPVFIEELYDVNLMEMVATGEISEISKTVECISELKINSLCQPVISALEIPTEQLTSKEIGKKFIHIKSKTSENEKLYTAYKYENGKYTTSGKCQIGTVYIVKRVFDESNGNTVISYAEYPSPNDVKDIYDTTTPSGNTIINKDDVVRLKEIDTISGKTVMSYVIGALSNDTNYFKKDNQIYTSTDKEITKISLSNYREQFRCAVTPWIVSELKGTSTDVQVKKLFRFFTITDGDAANTQVKISITNIKPEDGTFDVIVRDFYDSDNNVNILESFRGLTMIPGDNKYIGYKIGTLDGAYELKSKYIMADVIENSITETCVPCGFLGYPVRYYGENIKSPTFTYNLIYNPDETKAKNQYFGLSDKTGIDIDMLSYKGKNAYHDSDMSFGYTDPFHLDSTLSPDFRGNINFNVTVDGDNKTSGFTWETVSSNNLSDNAERPIIGSEEEMSNTIYGDIKLRKFTLCFYGGFDGWDIYRQSRTNTDDFKANKYKGTISNTYGRTFSQITNGDSLSLSGYCITSDYYAYLAGVKQFENPEKIAINIFATPGIDYVNNTLLVNEVIDVIEEKRGDSIYVVTTPDKPKGASDAPDEMYSGMDAAGNLEDTGIDTYYATTYYPWVKFHDKSNNKYIFLPPTKDVVRNMADVDNKKYPWYAPAGLERGNVECVKAHMFTRLEDENEIYDGRINPVKTFAKDGVKIWGNKTMYTGNTPMNRVNVVRLMLYMQKLIKEASLKLIFDPNDATLKKQFEDIVKPILAQIKADRGITDYRLNVSQTTEQMDAHELSANIGVKPTPTLEYIELNFTVTPQGVDFDDVM